MTTIIEAEAKRLAEQRRLDQLKTAKERNKWGQFATPPCLSLEIARYAWQRLRHRMGGFRFLDPAIGRGSFFGAFLQAFDNNRIEAAAGIELDTPFAETAAAIWGRQGLSVIHGDFFTVKRGLATGNNSFFILSRDRLDELEIPLECVRPILPSPRILKEEIVAADADGWPRIDRRLGIIDCDLDEAEVRKRWPRFADYLESGKRQSVHEGRVYGGGLPKMEPSELMRLPAGQIAKVLDLTRQRQRRMF